MNFPLLVLVSLLALSLSSCSSDPSLQGSSSVPGQAPTLSPHFTSLQANIFIPKCVSCHSSSRAAAGVNLESHRTVVNTADSHGHTIVVSESPETSHLLTIVQAQAMPPSPAPPLSDQEVQAIRDWISAGALND